MADQLRCNICGASIGGERRFTWMNEYRALYAKGREWFGARLSGVGVKRDLPISGLVRIPVGSRRQAFDNGGHDDPPEEIDIMPTAVLFQSDGKRLPWEQFGEGAENRSWGVFFHENCWRLFEAACGLEKISLSVVMGICMSFPIHPPRLIDWGHDYGGIYDATPDRVPEAGRFLGDFKTPRRADGMTIRRAAEVFQFDPLDIPSLDHFLMDAAERLEDGSQGVRGSKISWGNRLGTRGDCFATLPVELREIILGYLPTRDVLNLFLSSRTFASSPLPQGFWASRFNPCFEFSWVLERNRSRNNGSPVDWKALFYYLKYGGHISDFPIVTFRNRKRIWDLLLPLTEAVIDISNNPRMHGTPQNLRQQNLQWRRVGGLVEGGKVLDEGCRVLFVRNVIVPKVAVGIFVSTIQIGGADFVTGLRFIDGNGTSSKLGYVFPGKESYIDVSRVDTGKESSEFRGFYLAAGLKGIKAVAAITGTGKLSSWAGKPENIPRGRLIPLQGAMRDLKGEFDGVKLISLSIPDEDPVQKDHLGQVGISITPLRERFVWSPDAPSENLCLNEDDFALAGGNDTGKGIYSYRRLLWMHFGGPGGAYLRHVVSITCCFLDRLRKTRIEIRYDREIEGSTTCVLGGPDPDESDEDYSLGRNARNEVVRTPRNEKEDMTFAIDGAGGEYITAVGLSEPGTAKYLKSIQVWTNRGRSIHFTRDASPQSVSMYYPRTFSTQCGEGVAVTGFYAKADPLLLRLGVITERVSF